MFSRYTYHPDGYQPHTALSPKAVFLKMALAVRKVDRMVFPKTREEGVIAQFSTEVTCQSHSHNDLLQHNVFEFPVATKILSYNVKSFISYGCVPFFLLKSWSPFKNFI